MTQTTTAICVGNPMVLSLDIYIFVIVSDFVFQIVSCHGGLIEKVWFSIAQDLVRCAHNWNDEILECWENGFAWQTVIAIKILVY